MRVMMEEGTTAVLSETGRIEKNHLVIQSFQVIRGGDSKKFLELPR